MPVVVSNLKRINNKTIKAIFSIELPSGVIFNSCLLVYRSDRRCFSITPPQIPVLDSSGAIARDHRGETRFESAMTFKALEARRRFEDTCFAALRQVDPGLLQP